MTKVNHRKSANAAPGLWTIERLVAGGQGLARLSDGQVGLASSVAVGDVLEPLEVVRRRGVVLAHRWRMVEPGPGRVEPECPVAARCGGCDFMHLSRDHQLAAKRSIVVEALKRIGRIHDGPEVPALRTAGEPWRYRSRLRVHLDGHGRVGLFARSSRELVEIEDCPVSSALIGEALRTLRAIAALPACRTGGPFDLELRTAPAGPALLLRLLPSRGAAPSATFVGELEQQFVLHNGFDPVRFEREQRYPLPGGVELWAPPSAFTQVNWAVNAELIAAVVGRAAERGVGRFLDLYCGAGNFSLPLLARGLSGVGIEQSTDAVAAASRAARAQGLGRGEFRGGDVATELRRMAARRERVELVVLDPPRAGARPVLSLLGAFEPRFIALCACDPVTAARDVALLAQQGYRLTQLESFDMFPQTHHLEVLAWLERAG